MKRLRGPILTINLRDRSVSMFQSAQRASKYLRRHLDDEVAAFGADGQWLDLLDEGITDRQALLASKEYQDRLRPLVESRLQRSGHLCDGNAPLPTLISALVAHETKSHQLQNRKIVFRVVASLMMIPAVILQFLTYAENAIGLLAHVLSFALLIAAILLWFLPSGDAG